MSAGIDLPSLAERLIEEAGLKPLHWLDGIVEDGPEGYIDAGLSLCRACAERLVALGRAERVDGGWEDHEEDSPAYCGGGFEHLGDLVCGAALHYSMTAYCRSEAEQELFDGRWDDGLDHEFGILVQDLDEDGEVWDRAILAARRSGVGLDGVEVQR